MLKGKRISILGDSISTYSGYSNDSSANKATSCNKVFYKDPFPLEKTYWMKTLLDLGLTLCVNNSQSGGNLSGKEDETAGINRANNLARDNGQKPDIIIVFMGINDLGRGIDPAVFANDYKETLKIIKEKHENAYVCCVNIPDRDIYLKNRAIIFNELIDNATKEMGEKFFIADLFTSRLNNDFYYNNTLDGLHPDEDGMRIISEIVSESIKQNIKNI